MDVRNQPRPGTRPTAQSDIRPVSRGGVATGNGSAKAADKRSRALLLPGIAAAVVVLLLIGGFVWWKTLSGPAPASGQYQAVFLTNGQAYFGTLTNTDGTYLHLENAYYTKKQDVPANATDAQKKAVEGNVSLVRVGDEVYGPESSLNIKSEQVLFWQNLKPDSKVAKAIDSAKSE